MGANKIRRWTIKCYGSSTPSTSPTFKNKPRQRVAMDLGENDKKIGRGLVPTSHRKNSAASRPLAGAVPATATQRIFIILIFKGKGT